MKRLSILCSLILIATSTFAAENVAKGEPLSGTLLVDTEVLKQGLEGRTSLPIFLNKDLRVIVPQIQTPDGIALAKAANQWLSTPGTLSQLGRLIRTWKADYVRNQPALHGRYPTLTDFANDKLVQHLNANGTGSRGRTASEQILAQAYTLRDESIAQSTTLSVRENLNGGIDGPPAEAMGGFCGPNGHMATMHYCCVDTGDGPSCEFCDCWGAFTNCCVFGPLELRPVID